MLPASYKFCWLYIYLSGTCVSSNEANFWKIYAAILSATPLVTQHEQKTFVNDDKEPPRHMSGMMRRLWTSKNEALAARDTILKRWDLSEEQGRNLDMLLDFSDKGKPTKARSRLRAKLVIPIISDEDKKFTVAFAGTSVTAGHDNWFNQSYPLVYEETMRPILEAGGVDFTVRNHATGGNAISPSHFCAPSQLDGHPSDLDHVVYEFAMISARDDCRFEYFVRSVMMLPRRPTFMAWTTSGVSWRDDKETPKENKGKYPGPKLLTKQKCKGKWVIGHYAKNGAHIGDMTHVMHRIQHLAQFSASLMMGGKAIHCANVDGRPPEANRGCEEVAERAMKRLRQKEHVDPRRRRLAPFHPGPGAHEFQGTALAYAHLGVLIEGIEAALKAITKASDAPANGIEQDEDTEVLVGQLQGGSGHQSMPPPIGCHPAYCGNASSSRCYTTYDPHGPSVDLRDLVKGGRPPAIRHDSFGGANEAAKSIVTTGKSGWVLAAPPGLDFEHHAAYGYLDFKYALMGRPTSGTLTLQFSVEPAADSTVRTTPVVVCQPQCPWGKCKADQRTLEDDDSVHYLLDGVSTKPIAETTLEPHDRLLAKKGVCCVVGYVDKPQKKAIMHELSIDVAAGLVLISHLLWF